MNEVANNNVDGEVRDVSGALSLSDRVRSLRLPDRPTGRAGGVAWLPWALCAVLAVVAVYAGFFRPNVDKDFQEYLELKKTFGNPVEVLTSRVKERENSAKRTDPALGAIALESKGYILPISLIQVSPKVGGMVTKLYITEGMRVKKDFLLAELEDIDYKAEYDHAVAIAAGAQRKCDELWKYRDQEIKQAAADLADCKAQRDQLLLDFDRSQKLKKSNPGALADKEYEQAESAYRSMDYRSERLKLVFDLLVKGPRDEKIAAAKADCEQAKADEVKAAWRLGNTKVKAPIEGIILSKKAEEGNMVNPSAFSNGLSASLCEMADLTKMEVDLAIAERDISKVYDEQECIVRAEAFPERTYIGWVTRRMPTADRSKGAVPVRVQIKIDRAEEGQYLRPDMGAVVTFFNKKIDPAKKK
jgi:multidrug resistance efflux pump